MSLSAGRAAFVFLSFACAYFLSALLRAVTATLAVVSFLVIEIAGSSPPPG